MQQGQNQKEILVQLGYSVFNLRMVEGQNRVQGQKNRYKEIKIQIDQTPVLEDTIVIDFEDTVVIEMIFRYWKRYEYVILRDSEGTL